MKHDDIHIHPIITSMDNSLQTLAMDRERLAKLGVLTQEMVALTSVVLVTLSVVGSKLRDLTAFKQRLKDNCMVLLHAEGGCSDE
jgi:hypothetical protein